MKQNIDMLDITTSNLEKYKCAIPVDLADDEVANLAAVNNLFRICNLIKIKIILKFKENKIFEQNQIVTSSLFDPIYNRKFCSYRVILGILFFRVISILIFTICFRLNHIGFMKFVMVNMLNNIMRLKTQEKEL